MNDPGLDEPISTGAQEVEREQSSQPKDPDGADADAAYLQPSRWWFASTAFPLMAGTFGPMASAFNICALAAKWRSIQYPGDSEDNGQVVQDPSWLIGINAVSLVIALIANLALLMNMAKRLSFKIAQPITIIGWYISGFILVGLVIAAVKAKSFQLPPEPPPHLTQAFYYAIMAAALYLIIASLMLFTVYGAYAGYYEKNFELTTSQRTLMVQTISFLFYLLAGAAVFSTIENWLFLNGVYWATATLLTVGTGDFYPKTHLGQGLIMPYAIGGVVTLGLVIGSIRSLILERSKTKLSARMMEKKREDIVRQWEKDGKKVQVSLIQHSHDLTGEGKGELERREREFNVMRLVQQHAQTERKWMSLTLSLTSWFILWFIGAVVFWRAERLQQGLTYYESMYYCYITLLTIGYGDYAPVANSSKAFFVFWALLAVPTLTILISNMGDTVVKLIRDLTMWAAEFTVLPGEGSTRDRLKKVMKQKHIQKIFNSDQTPAEETPGGAFMPEGDRDIEGQHDNSKHGQMGKAASHLGGELEKTELSDVERARRSGNRVDKDIALYHYLLVHEIKKVMKDVGQEPPKKYSFNDWQWFLRLLGEQEDDEKFHRKPPVEATEEDLQKSVGLGQVKWSWLGARSPLLGEMDEPDWVLDHLVQKLEQLLMAERHRKDKKSNARKETEDDGDASSGTLDGPSQSYRDVPEDTALRTSHN
jgi:potassium channel subfamily K